MLEGLFARTESAGEMDLSYGSRGASGPWLRTCKVTCALQVLGGILLIVASSSFLFDYSKVTGQAIGLLLVCVGAVGYYGSLRSNREALNLHLIGILVAMMMAFTFIGQVVRETDVDCALAEMYVRGLATEQLIKKQHESEIFNSLYTRLNEMEDMMQGVENGAFKRAEHKQEQQNLKKVDEDYVMAKLMMLHDHAEELAKQVATDNRTNPEHLDGWSNEEKKEIYRVLEVCDNIIRKLRGLDEKGNPLPGEHVEVNYEDYEAMLSELAKHFADTRAGKVHIKGDAAHLEKALEELPNMKGAMERLESNHYESLKIGAVGEEVEALNKLAEEQSERRKEWATEFATELAKHKQSNKMDFDMRDLPEHCLVETKGRGIMTLAGFVTLVSQAISGFCVLTTLFKIPMKID